MHNPVAVLSQVDKGKFSSPSPWLTFYLDIPYNHVKGGGRLEHESIGDAIYTLNKKLKVNNIVLKGKFSYFLLK